MEVKTPSGLSALSHEEILELDRDYLSAARKAKLRYVNHGTPGISASKRRTGFVCIFCGATVRDEEELARIHKLALRRCGHCSSPMVTFRLRVTMSGTVKNIGSIHCGMRCGMKQSFTAFLSSAKHCPICAGKLRQTSRERECPGKR